MKKNWVTAVLLAALPAFMSPALRATVAGSDAPFNYAVIDDVTSTLSVYWLEGSERGSD